MDKIKLRILDQKKHERNVKDFDFELENENNLYATFINITEIQHGQLEYSIDSGIYRLCGDEDYDFVDVNTTSKHSYKNFEDYYEQHKAEYMAGETSDKREHKRIHDGFHDIIHLISKRFKGNNVTATTTLLLQFGAYEFYNNVSIDEFETINQAYFKAATSAFDHKKYFDGWVTKTLLGSPAVAYANSRAVILDVTRKDKQMTFYQTDYVFKTLENIHRIGFEGTSARFGYELLIALALSNCELMNELGMHQKMYKLSSPTIDEIKAVISSNML